jgi:DNA-binding NtrC family response regulator
VAVALNRRLALVAVENDSLSALFAATLVDLGYDVVRARNGRELLWGYLSLGARGDIEVVVAELRLPDHPVLDVAEAWARGNEAPRIVLVGNGTVGERRRAAGLGLTLVGAPEAARLLQEHSAVRRHRAARMPSRRRESPERTRLPSATHFMD